MDNAPSWRRLLSGPDCLACLLCSLYACSQLWRSPGDPNTRSIVSSGPINQLPARSGIPLAGLGHARADAALQRLLYSHVQLLSDGAAQDSRSRRPTGKGANTGV